MLIPTVAVGYKVRMLHEGDELELPEAEARLVEPNVFKGTERGPLRHVKKKGGAEREGVARFSTSSPCFARGDSARVRLAPRCRQPSSSLPFGSWVKMEI